MKNSQIEQIAKNNAEKSRKEFIEMLELKEQGLKQKVGGMETTKHFCS